MANDYIKVVSFSGGKDSTVMLSKLIKDNIQFNEVIYVEDFFPYPRYIMDYYLKYIEEYFNIKITRLPLSYEREVMKNKIYPSSRIRYCSRLKAEVQCHYLKKKYGNHQKVLFYIGIRKDESKQRNRYSPEGDWSWNKRFHVNYKYFYPIFDFTEKSVFDYLTQNKIKLNPLYYILNTKRLGCSLCMYSSNSQKRNFYKNFPDDFEKFVEFEKKMKDVIQNKNLKMFPQISINDLKDQFVKQRDLDSFLRAKPNITESPHLFPIIKEMMDSFSTSKVVDMFIDIIKIDMSDNFYNLPKETKEKHLNEIFPDFLSKLSITNKQILHYITSRILESSKLKLIYSLKDNLYDFSQNEAVKKFLEEQRERLEGGKEHV